MLKKITNNFNFKLAISLFVLLIAIIYLGTLALESSKTYYLTINEIQNTPDNTKSVRVAGKLVQDSYTRSEASTVSKFEITDEGRILKASYEGVVPDMFFSSKSDTIILEGKLNPKGEFEAENIIVKCPSKYEE